MSDNPADSLRRELRDALAADCQSVPCIDKVHWADADRVLPIVEAARADERERLEKAVGAHRGKILTTADATFAALVRGLSEGAE